MRAVSLSDTRVIDLLNRYFVPVYTSNEDYAEKGGAPPEEKAQLNRIREEGYARKLSVGTVHAYVLTPDGHTLDSLHVAQAYQPDRLAAMLRRAVLKLGTAPGPPVLAPAPQDAVQPKPDALLLHLTARYLARRGDDYVLTTSATANWNAFPGEDWISLERAQWVKLLPPEEARVGTSWEVDRDVTALLLTHFYPPTENNDLATNRLEKQSLRGVVVARENGGMRVRLEGALTLKHPFYHKDDKNVAEASFVGFLEYREDTKRIGFVRLVTEEAVYGEPGAGQPYGVALRSVP
jgi:hypothetical protein